DATGIVGDRPARPGGAQGHVPLAFRNVNPHKARHVHQRHACRPDLAETGSMAPHTCTGSGSPGRDDPRAAPVSTDQGSIGLSRPGTARRGCSHLTYKDTRLLAVRCSALFGWKRPAGPRETASSPAATPRRALS